MVTSRSRVWALVLLVGLLLAACGPKEFRDAENGGAVELKVGETMRVTLASNPTTGYSWQILTNDPQVLELQGDPVYRADPSAQGLVGAGGTETFTFVARQAGTVKLALGYLRPWEEGVPPVQTYTLTVTVR